MKLRVLESNWKPFVEALCTRQDVETAGVVLAKRITSDLLLGQEFALVPESGYAIRQPNRLRIDPVALNRLIRPARDRGLSIFTVHTHPGAQEPWFSEADDIGDSVLMPSLFAQTDGPHGSLVVAGNTRVPVARAWQQLGPSAGIDMQVVGRVLKVAAGSRTGR